MKNEHFPVLLTEVISFWGQKKSGIFVDATFGRGGHSQALLKLLKSTDQLLGLDIDQAAIESGQDLAKKNSCFTMINSNFRYLQQALIKYRIKKVDGLLFDFGVSSPQLDTVNRGFSYRSNAQLDMRMNLNQPWSAWDVINTKSATELSQIFSWYGECPCVNLVAKKIVQTRQKKSINTTKELVEIIKTSLPTRLLHTQKHPARTFFQALRIYVNDELNAIKDVLSQLPQLLSSNGVAVFLTFHSLEEKIIKHWIKRNCGVINLPNVPIQPLNYFRLLTKKPICPSASEIIINPRSRSVKLFAVQRN